MRFEEALFLHLKNHSGIKSIVQERIYPLIIPQKSIFPVLVYQKISSERLHSLSGDTGASMPYYQISCWADSYLAVKLLGDQVRFCLQNHRGKLGGISGVDVSGTLLRSESEGMETDTNKYYVYLDFQFFFMEPIE
jgi:hypothetical protein